MCFHFALHTDEMFFLHTHTQPPLKLEIHRFFLPFSDIFFLFQIISISLSFSLSFFNFYEMIPKEGETVCEVLNFVFICVRKHWLWVMIDAFFCKKKIVWIIKPF